jgi:hypothetical protein
MTGCLPLDVRSVPLKRAFASSRLTASPLVTNRNLSVRRVVGLLVGCSGTPGCLFDASGACANPVKDSQRTKTSPQTTSTLSVVWGAKALTGRTAKAAGWYRDLRHAAGATTELVTS